jgi:hypothetical protein
MKVALLAVPAAMLLSTGHCLSNSLKLDVTFYTQISADGGCTRRTEYRLTFKSERTNMAMSYAVRAAAGPVLDSRPWRAGRLRRTMTPPIGY